MENEDVNKTCFNISESYVVDFIGFIKMVNPKQWRHVLQEEWKYHNDTHL